MAQGDGGDGGDANGGGGTELTTGAGDAGAAANYGLLFCAAGGGGGSGASGIGNAGQAGGTGGAGATGQSVAQTFRVIALTLAGAGGAQVLGRTDLTHGTNVLSSGLTVGGTLTYIGGLANGNDKLIDGNLGTECADPSGYNTGTYWKVDFGSGVTVDISSFLIDKGATGLASSPTLVLEYSDDDSSWTQAGYTFAWSSGTTNEDTVVQHSGGAHRYWRFYYSGGTTGGNFWLAELEMYENTYFFNPGNAGAAAADNDWRKIFEDELEGPYSFARLISAGSGGAYGAGGGGGGGAYNHELTSSSNGGGWGGGVGDGTGTDVGDGNAGAAPTTDSTAGELASSGGGGGGGGSGGGNILVEAVGAISGTGSIISHGGDGAVGGDGGTLDGTVTWGGSGSGGGGGGGAGGGMVVVRSQSTITITTVAATGGAGGAGGVGGTTTSSGPEYLGGPGGVGGAGADGYAVTKASLPA